MASLGVAVFSLSETDIEKIFRRYDDLMYLVPKRGDQIFFSEIYIG